ncbi:unnamed protein product [Oikopleura dioica]|uniref:Calponin-homology (CH) domain-containing protein n=2 Tax=Oikopleura dioica TaxID=34765 RepID=E4WRC3_OIKDI|nr:unnamed protein product [Oikopleura dioica]
MTVAPRKKTLDEIYDIDELEKMLDEENDYEARKAIRSRLRSLHKAKTAEIENRQKAKTQLPLNIPTTDDEIVVEKRTRGRARVQRSMSSVASLQSSTSTERLADKKNDLGRVSRTPSQASLREDDFGAAESSSSPSPSESSIAARSRPQTAQPKSSSSVGASPKTQTRPSTAKPATISQTVETAELVSKSSSSGKSKLYTDSGRSMTVGAISDLSSTSFSKSMSKKESAIADLKRRTDQRKAELTRIQSMPNGGTSGAAAARKKFMSRLGEDNPENRKLRRSNTISGGGPTGVKSLLLKWCQVRCKDYPVEVNNYSSSWADGSAFCALTHSFFPDAFKWDDVILNTDNNDERRKNFSLAFDTALEKADAEPLIEVEDMIFMGNRPDAKCIFCYLQSLYNKLRKFEQPIEKKDLDV